MFTLNLNLKNDPTSEYGAIFMYGWHSLAEVVKDQCKRYSLPLRIVEDNFKISISADDLVIFRYHWKNIMEHHYFVYLSDYLFDYGFEVEYSTTNGESGIFDDDSWKRRNKSALDD